MPRAIRCLTTVLFLLMCEAPYAEPQPVYYIFEFRGAGDPVGGIEHSLAYLKQRARKPE